MNIMPPLESDMQFGPFCKDRFIHWEITKLCKVCGEGYKCVEYILQDDNHIDGGKISLDSEDRELIV